MKLRSISIKNYRCIENIKISVRDFTSLIGPNNCGKSSVLAALEIFLNQQSPRVEEWRTGHRDQEIEIEGEFDGLQDWEKASQGVSGIVYNDKIQLRLRILLDPETEKISKIYEAFKPEETITGWSDQWGSVDEIIKAIAGELGITGAQWRTASKKEEVRKKIRETRPDLIVHSEPKWTNENISIDAALQQALPQVQLIPAVKDARDDGKPGAKTSFGVILSKIILPAVQASEEYSNLLNVVKALQTKLASEGADQIPQVAELTRQLSERISSIIDAKFSLTMDTPDAEKFIGANTGIVLDDGTKTSVGLQGSGLQRSLVFALMEVLAGQNAQIRNVVGELLKSRSTIILFEEPELFLHPHIMRRLKNTLHTISKKEDWQVMVTTHSPFLIDIGQDPLSLVVVKRINSQTAPTASQLQQDPFGQDEPSRRDREALRAVLDFHPTVCEAFFAKRTVLVEGDSEMALLHSKALYEKAGVNEATRALCTVVSCGGKWTIAPIARLLNQFQIPFRIIHDMDKKGRTDEELAEVAAIDPFKANERIAATAPAGSVHIVNDTLEDIFWDPPRPRSSGDKPYRVWKRAKELCDAGGDLKVEVRDLIQFAFNW